MSTSTPSQHAPAEDAHHDEGSKLKTFVAILRRFVGVADLASVRFSLPSQLLEPTPNLEYWNYLDSPNAFVAIGTSNDPLDRMLEVLRFWFTKDLKYAKGRPCKPYNSCLGEFFRCNWEAEDNAPCIRTQSDAATTTTTSCASSAKSSVRSSKLSLRGSSAEAGAGSSVSVTRHAENPTAPTVRVSYLTEQTSHHPPVSAFYVSCPEKGLHARGFDQISAKFTGTSIKVMAGEHNLGIFITLEHRNETYQLIHPAAHLGGFLRGALNISVGDAAYIQCPQIKLKAILHYSDQGWLRGSANRVDGVVFRYDPDHDDKTKIKDVPEADVLVRLGGSWKEQVQFTLGSAPFDSHPREQRTTLIDVNPLSVAPKRLPPREYQLPNESLELWHPVTEAIHAKQFSKATSAKLEIEERQREKARERDRLGQTWQPVFFAQVTDKGGRPDLTDKGRQVLERAQRGEWSLVGVLPNAPNPSMAAAVASEGVRKEREDGDGPEKE